jgi:hypothetical protein
MSKIESPTRDGCVIGGRDIGWSKLERYYVCNECGSPPVHTFKADPATGKTVDYARCGDLECASEDFISESAFVRQVYDAQTITRNLPPELAALVGRQEQGDPQESRSELFDL